MNRAECCICEAPAITLLCDACGRAYDRWHDSSNDDGTLADMIRWVARRTRRMTVRMMYRRRPTRRHDG